MPSIRSPMPSRGHSSQKLILARPDIHIYIYIYIFVYTTYICIYIYIDVTFCNFIPLLHPWSLPPKDTRPLDAEPHTASPVNPERPARPIKSNPEAMATAHYCKPFGVRLLNVSLVSSAKARADALLRIIQRALPHTCRRGSDMRICEKRALVQLKLHRYAWRIIAGRLTDYHRFVWQVVLWTT